jgi:hypothetical protein
LLVPNNFRSGFGGHGIFSVFVGGHNNKNDRGEKRKRGEKKREKRGREDENGLDIGMVSFWFLLLCVERRLKKCVTQAA